jgi:hypothetical protein
MQQYLNVKGGKAVYSVAIIPAITIAHHTYFLFHLLVSARLQCSSATWPATPLFGERNQTRYFLSLSFLWVCYIFLSPRFIEQMAWGSWHESIPEFFLGSCYVLLCFVLIAGFISAREMLETEVKAKCLQEGHEWMCVRICSLVKEAGQ